MNIYVWIAIWLAFNVVIFLLMWRRGVSGDREHAKKVADMEKLFRQQEKTLTEIRRGQADRRNGRGLNCE